MIIKRTLSILMVIFILFAISSETQPTAQAVDLVVTPTVLLLAALLVTMGMVFATEEQAQAMAQWTYDNLPVQQREYWEIRASQQYDMYEEYYENTNFGEYDAAEIRAAWEQQGMWSNATVVSTDAWNDLKSWLTGQNILTDQTYNDQVYDLGQLRLIGNSLISECGYILPIATTTLEVMPVRSFIYNGMHYEIVLELILNREPSTWSATIRIFRNGVSQGGVGSTITTERENIVPMMSIVNHNTFGMILTGHVYVNGQLIISSNLVQLGPRLTPNPTVTTSRPNYNSFYPTMTANGFLDSTASPGIVITVPSTWSGIPGRTWEGVTEEEENEIWDEITRTRPGLYPTRRPVRIPVRPRPGEWDDPEVKPVEAPPDPNQQPDPENPNKPVIIPMFPPQPQPEAPPDDKPDPDPPPTPRPWTPIPLPRPHPRPEDDTDTDPDDDTDLGPDVVVVPDPYENPQPSPRPSPAPGDGTDPDPGQQQQPGDRNIPPFVPRSPQSVFAMFPFCIPWDLYNFVDVITAEGIEPVIEIDAFGFLKEDGITIEPWVLEFSQFDVPRLIFRYCMLVLGLIGLFKATKKYIWTGGG